MTCTELSSDALLETGGVKGGGWDEAGAMALVAVTEGLKDSGGGSTRADEGGTNVSECDEEVGGIEVEDVIDGKSGEVVAAEDIVATDGLIDEL